MPEPHVNVVAVERGQYVTIPDATNHVLVGPGKLEVTRYPDGSVRGRIVEGSASEARLAIKRKLKRVSWGI